MTKERVTYIAMGLLALFVLGMAVYGANQLVNSFFDKNVVSPRGVVQTLKFQAPRLWVDKQTFEKEKAQDELINGAVDKAVDEILNATPTPKPRSLKVGEVLAAEYTWNDAIRQVFPADEAGRMIRICLKENNKADKWVRAYNTNGSYDFGPCQVNSVHKPKGMSFDEWDTYLKDTINYAKEVRKVYLSQGWSAWVVFNKGLVK